MDCVLCQYTCSSSLIYSSLSWIKQHIWSLIFGVTSIFWPLELTFSHFLERKKYWILTFDPNVDTLYWIMFLFWRSMVRTIRSIRDRTTKRLGGGRTWLNPILNWGIYSSHCCLADYCGTLLVVHNIDNASLFYEVTLLWLLIYYLSC